MRRFLLALFVTFALVSTPLFAQGKEITKGKVGLTFPSLGAIWHITDHVAFVPGVGFNHYWTSVSGLPNTSSSNSLTVAAGLRFYMREWKGVRFYLTPRYQFGWGTGESVSGASATSSNTAYSHFASGAWGLQYAISDRVSIFGDLGAGYYRTTSSSSISSGHDSHANQIYTTGSWGLILYLR